MGNWPNIVIRKDILKANKMKTYQLIKMWGYASRNDDDRRKVRIVAWISSLFYYAQNGFKMIVENGWKTQIRVYKKQECTSYTHTHTHKHEHKYTPHKTRIWFQFGYCKFVCV